MRLLEMSLSAGVLILFVTLVRRGGMLRLAKRTVRMLWIVVLARLLLPFSLPVQGGIVVPVHSLLQKVLHGIQQHRAIGGDGTVSGIMSEAASSGITGHTGESAASQAVWWIWVAGMTVTGIYFAVSFWKEYCLLAQAIPVKSVPGTESTAKSMSDVPDENMPENMAGKVLRQNTQLQLLEACSTARRITGMKRGKDTDQLWVHDRIQSPVVFGILKQRITVPKDLRGLEPSQIQYVLAHEMIHIRRRDNLWKLLSAAALCIHWFNPAVWLMYLLFSRDLELSCDERVLSLYGSKGRKEYAVTLLALAQNQKKTTLFCSGFLENPVKERIVAIMNYKKLTGIGVLCAVMLLAGASSVFATNESVDSGKAGAESLQEAGDEAEKDAAGGAQSAADTAGEAKKAASIADGTEKSADTAGGAEKSADTAGGTDKADEGQLVKYTIVNAEDGAEYILHSGKADAEILGPDVIRVTLSEELYTEDGQEKTESYYTADDGSVYRLEKDSSIDVYRLEKDESTSDEKQVETVLPDEITDAETRDSKYTEFRKALSDKLYK